MSQNQITPDLIFADANTTSQLKMFAATVRQFLEPHWLSAHQGWDEVPDPLSRWMCRYSSIFLATLLRELEGQETWCIVGGRPPRSLNATAEGEFGMLACDGTWNDHCWVTGRGLILDLTADQFGHDPVIVTASSDPRYRANLTEDDMAQAFQKLQRRSTPWLAAWRFEQLSNSSSNQLVKLSSNASFMNPQDPTPRILHLGDDINTDDIIPAKRGTNGDRDHLKRYAFEHLIGEGKLLEYDIIEAGENFGCGSSREFAPIAIQAAGIQKVRAHSFAEIFYRNSINIGLPLEILPPSSDQNVSETLTPQPSSTSHPLTHSPTHLSTHPLPTPHSPLPLITQTGGLFPFNQLRRAGQITLPPSQTPPRPMTMAEKLLAHASGNDYVQPGEVVFAKVDLAMSHDAIASEVAERFQQEFGADAKVWDADRIVFVADHFIQINDIRSDAGAIQMHRQMVAFAKAQDCRLFDVVSPGEAAGICHVLLPEQGLIQPGMVIAGTDSHSCTYGAFGCFSTGVGTTDMANLFAMGDLWLRVPGTLLFELSGTLPNHVSAKDIMLFILGQIGCDGAVGKVMEFRGSIIDTLPMDERMTLANMAIECGALCGLIAVDETTRSYLRDRGQTEFLEITGDPDAQYDRIYAYDLSTLEPQIACPPKPDQVVGISELADVPITRAFIGSCTGGKLHDLQQAAVVLKGRKVAPGVSLFVVPASQQIRQQAEASGDLQILEQAGAQVLKSGCGACINAGFGVLGKQETGIYATNRNFKGRSGDPTAKNYLASPRIVAISAVQGKISDRLDP